MRSEAAVSSGKAGFVSPTGEEERDEAGFFWHVELEAGAAEDVLDHGLRSAGSLQEGQELLGFLRFLKHKRERGRRSGVWLCPTTNPVRCSSLVGIPLNNKTNATDGGFNVINFTRLD